MQPNLIDYESHTPLELDLMQKVACLESENRYLRGGQSSMYVPSLGDAPLTEVKTREVLLALLAETEVLEGPLSFAVRGQTRGKGAMGYQYYIDKTVLDQVPLHMHARILAEQHRDTMHRLAEYLKETR